MAIDPNIKNKAQKIRTEIYGKDVRESLASGLEAMSEDVVDNKNRQDSVEDRFQDVIDGTTDKDVISAPEILDARQGHSNLGQNLLSMKQQLQHNASYATTTFNYLADSKKEKKFIVSFVADDAPKNDLTKLLPIMQEKNIPVGIGVITSRVGKTVPVSGGHNVEYMTWEEIKFMESQGAEIMSHSHNHRLSTSLSKEELYEDLKTSKRILSEKGYLADGFIYPGNDYNGNTKKIVKQFFKYAFTSKGGVGNFFDFSNNAITRVNLGAIGDNPEEGFPEDTLSLEYYKSRIDWSIENDNWLVFILHTALPDMLDTTQQEYLKSTIDYIRSKGGEIVSPREGFARYGNIIQIGEKALINANGEIEGVNIDKIDEHSLSSKIDDFALNAITYTPISGGTDLLITYNFLTVAGRRYQEYITTSFYTNGDINRRVMTRDWRNGEWSSFRNANALTVNSDISSVNSRLLTKPMTEYDMHHITVNQIKSPASSGWPENKAGTLTTFRLGTEFFHQYQKYELLIIYNSQNPDLSTHDLVRKTYVRYWYNNEWTPFKLESETKPK